MGVRRRWILGVLTVTTLLAATAVGAVAPASADDGGLPAGCGVNQTCIDDPDAGCDYIKSCQPPGTGVKSSYCFVTVDDIMLCRD